MSTESLNVYYMTQYLNQQLPGAMVREPTGILASPNQQPQVTVFRPEFRFTDPWVSSSTDRFQPFFKSIPHQQVVPSEGFSGSRKPKRNLTTLYIPRSKPPKKIKIKINTNMASLLWGINDVAGHAAAPDQANCYS